MEGSSAAQVEHIDNPKGYGEGKDPRDVDPGLRPVFSIFALVVPKVLTLVGPTAYTSESLVSKESSHV